MDERPNRRLLSVLDWTESLASLLLLALVYFLVIAATICLIWLLRNAPEGFGGQAEWFYVTVGYLMLIGWAIGQTIVVITRSRRLRRSEDDISIPLPKVESGPSGFSLQWGSKPPGGSGQAKNSWTSNLQTQPTTFRVDDAQLNFAQAAADAGRAWDDICREINPQYDALPDFERKLYQHAIRTAIDERRRQSRS
ncbi:MAG TPA: hypothetical protein VES67_23110 [Vicinamibacterales bacterium]|nr:hypothetical protein [Vicinamibacterales bacterium]